LFSIFTLPIISSSIFPDEIVVNKIYQIRDQKVMLDSDLAELYGVETKRLNEQVKRNLTRFPVDFMFQLTRVGAERENCLMCLMNMAF
jgi:hypothetical protein